MTVQPFFRALSGSLISLSLALMCNFLALAPLLFFPILLPITLAASIKMSRQHPAPYALWVACVLCLQTILLPLLWASNFCIKIPRNLVSCLLFGADRGWNNDLMSIFSTFEKDMDRANTTDILTHLSTLYTQGFSAQSSTFSLYSQQHLIWLLFKSLSLYSNEVLFDPRGISNEAIIRVKNQLNKQFNFFLKYPSTPLFESLELSSIEQASLCLQQSAPLSEKEFEQLNNHITDNFGEEESTHLSIKDALMRYQQLLKLHDCVCPILMRAPDEPILLIKQYKKEGKWHHVPYYSLLFDKVFLERWYGINPVLDKAMFLNPKSTAIPIDIPSTESLTQSLPYKSYETRFRYHPYRVNSSVINQELNELIEKLRQKCLTDTAIFAPQNTSHAFRYFTNMRCMFHLFSHAEEESIHSEQSHQEKINYCTFI